MLCAFQKRILLKKSAETLRSNLLHNGPKCLFLPVYLNWIERLLRACLRTFTIQEVESFIYRKKSGYYPLISAEKMPWFRCVVMVRNPRCISGNTLLVSVSQGKKYLSRTYQHWPWKKVHTKEKLRQVTFNVFCVRLICLISLIIDGFMDLLQCSTWTRTEAYYYHGNTAGHWFSSSLSDVIMDKDLN